MSAPCPTLGFRVTMERASDPGTGGDDALLNAWTDFLERRGLYYGGGGRRHLELVVASEAFQATENDREAALAWLASRPELKAWHVGDIEDLNRDDA
jgi:uncharacterized protein YggL (DUF469 family)